MLCLWDQILELNPQGSKSGCFCLLGAVLGHVMQLCYAVFFYKCGHTHNLSQRIFVKINDSEHLGQSLALSKCPMSELIFEPSSARELMFLPSDSFIDHKRRQTCYICVISFLVRLVQA